MSDEFEGGRLGIHYPDAGTEWLGGPDGRLTEVTFLPDGRRVYAIRDGTPTVYDPGDGWRTLDVDGTARLPPAIRDGAVFDAESVLVAGSSATRPGELVRLDVENGETTLVDTTPDDMDRSALIAPAEHTYPTDTAPDNGAPALVYEPAETPAPAVAVVYGAASGVARQYSPLAQTLVAAGYVVCRPAITPDPYSRAEHDAIAAVGRWLADRPFVDGRTVVYGHSHGGYDAYGQAVWHPAVWDAAVAYDGFADLPALAEADETLRNLRDHLPPYADAPDVWRELSPATDAGTLDVPLLALHGREDPLVPVSQARRFHETVEANDAGPMQYHELAGGHGGGTDTRQTTAAYRRLLAFLDRQL